MLYPHKEMKHVVNQFISDWSSIWGFYFRSENASGI